LCPEAQMMTIGIDAAVHVLRRMCIRGTRGWEAISREIALRAVRESEINETGRVDREGEVDKIRWKQGKIA